MLLGILRDGTLAQYERFCAKQCKAAESDSCILLRLHALHLLYCVDVVLRVFARTFTGCYSPGVQGPRPRWHTHRLRLTSFACLLASKLHPARLLKFSNWISKPLQKRRTHAKVAVSGFWMSFREAHLPIIQTIRMVASSLSHVIRTVPACKIECRLLACFQVLPMLHQVLPASPSADKWVLQPLPVFRKEKIRCVLMKTFRASLETSFLLAEACNLLVLSQCPPHEKNLFI